MGQEWILGGHLGGRYSSLGEVRGAWTKTEECNWGEASPFEMYLGQSIGQLGGWRGLSPMKEHCSYSSFGSKDGENSPGQIDMPVSTFKWNIKEQLEVWVCSSKDRPGERGELANRWCIRQRVWPRSLKSKWRVS